MGILKGCKPRKEVLQGDLNDAARLAPSALGGVISFERYAVERTR